MTQEKKLQYFEYLANKLIIWYAEINGNFDSDFHTFTRIKVQKLLFLAATINVTQANKDLLSVFDNFYAMQYGPVEIDIYDAMVNNRFSHISFTERHMKVRGNLSNIVNDLDNMIIRMIDAAIVKLRLENEQLINFTAIQLVDITHKWRSWKNAIDIAIALGNSSEKMAVDNICSDTKYFA